MKEYILEILTSLALAGAAAAVAWAVKNRKAQIKAALLGLIQQAETGIRGSGLGAEKKAWVLEQLELIEGQLPGWVDSAVDKLVALLNEKNAWLTQKAETAASGALDKVTGETDG
jgi:hypothetical protein